MQRLCLIPLVFLLNSCITHWIQESSTRLQLENRTGWRIANLCVVDPKGNMQPISWMPDTLDHGARSRVFTRELVGSFNFRISYADSSCSSSSCWKEQALGNLQVDGGTKYWRVARSGTEIVVEER